MLSRRDFAAMAFGTVYFGTAIARQDGGEVRILPRPSPTLLQSGDIVWPKKPGAYVPYHSGSSNDPAQDRLQWLEERDSYLRRHNAGRIESAVLRKRLTALQGLDYREFIAIYAGDQTPGVPGLYSGGALYVGHCGIIEIDQSGIPWVIEALVGRGVIRQPYEAWLNSRPEEVVWLGRLKELSSPERAKVAVEAKRHLGKPYSFWNFDLNDDSGFYCSKLVWMSVFRALGFAIDGVGNAERVLWLSPKQILYLETVERLHDPGPYAIS